MTVLKSSTRIVAFGSIVSVICSAFFFAGSLHSSKAWAQVAEGAIPIPETSPLRHAPIVKPKVINGKEAVLGQFPWVVSIGTAGGTRRAHRCTGSILSDRWVLSAAHCFTTGSGEFKTRVPSSAFAVQYGIVDLGKYESNRVKAVYVPGNIEAPVAEGRDIALVELASPLQLDGEAATAIDILPQERFVDVYNEKMDVEYAIMGFGVALAGASAVAHLRYGTSGPLSYSLCDSGDVYDGQLTPDMMCAGDIHDINEPLVCKGDSGGPLVWPAQPGTGADGSAIKQFVIGVASWQGTPEEGFGCTPESKKVAVYINASQYKEDILACIDGDGCPLKRYAD